MGTLFEKLKKHNTAKHMLFSGGLKLLSLVINLVYVPVVLNYLGVEKYGVWSTILTILSWVSYFDIGIGNGLRNKLTEALSEGRNADCKKLISSAYVFIAIIMFGLLVIGTLVSQFINWENVLGTSEGFDELLVLVICLSLLFVTTNFVLSICRNILYALQKASYVSILEVSTQLINLVSIGILSFFSKGTLLSVVIVYGISMVSVHVLCNVILFIKNTDFRPQLRHVDFALGRSITTLGIKFFIIQICALILFSTDSLMISMLYGAGEVTPYSTAVKVLTTIAGVYSAFLAPIWSAFTKAKTENNNKQMLRSLRNLQLFMIPFVLLAVLIAIFFKPITRIWLGQELSYSYAIVPFGLLYCIIMIWTNMYSTVGNGLELMKVSMIVALIQAIVNIPLSYLFAEIIGMKATGVLIGTDIAMSISAVVMPIYIYYWLKVRLKEEQSKEGLNSCGLATNRLEEADMEKVKIYYDYQIMMAQKYGGISRYYFELISHINESNEAFAEAKCIGNRNVYFENYFHQITEKHIFGIGKLNRYLASKKMRKYDIVHPTYYNPYVLKCKRKKLVITVYDMIHELFPEMFSSNDATAENKKQLIYGADHIIAISESTKNDIIRLYPDISPDKITVIYIGSNMMPNLEKLNINLPERFILFVGNRSLYKNFNRFMKSIRQILLDDPNLNLVCLGGGAFTEEEKGLIAEVFSQVFQMNAYDAELAYAYSKAVCFVFPSLYEGFGIPTLEAFSCNCPVLLSNQSSLPEVGGDAALYFDPYDEKDMYEKISKVITDAELRSQMIEKGRIQLQKFNWNDIAAQTIECYKKVLEAGKDK